MGVIFFVYNAAFALVLLLMVLVSSIYAVVSKNPDTRYQPMRDDRGSFIKSQSQLNTELDALGVTARGDMRMLYGKGRDLDDDDSFSSSSIGHQQDAAGVPLPPSTANSGKNVNPYSTEYPINSSTPFIPSDNGPRHGPPSHYSDDPRSVYNGSNYNDSAVFSSRPSNNNSPAPRYEYQPYSRTESPMSNSQSNVSYRPQTNAGPWQRGAGYDH